MQGLEGDGSPYGPVTSSTVTTKSNASVEKRSFHEKYETEVMLLRFLQVVLFFISYIFARTVGDFHDWKEKPQEVGLYTLLFLFLFAVLSHVLPKQVPLFLAVMALPPYVDDGNFKMLLSVIDDHMDPVEVEETAELIRQESQSSSVPTPDKPSAHQPEGHLSQKNQHMLSHTHLSSHSHPHVKRTVSKERRALNRTVSELEHHLQTVTSRLEGLEQRGEKRHSLGEVFEPIGRDEFEMIRRDVVKRFEEMDLRLRKVEETRLTL
eukprot:gnl/MRDRNA2_/MRDRNA2_15056_c0_seq1.p1 gnl/MRDRNA2_/MRDRNA2_15056_c0~~gnl/MRDRNA2_/MRDRNA2_15056_c0_seq1.p1  ORF type:complete len:265 (+),score=47.39 gnl/MRDRNA2_/MRDRNA2_15056_c0_seq1:2-796(+)